MAKASRNTCTTLFAVITVSSVKIFSRPNISSPLIFVCHHHAPGERIRPGAWQWMKGGEQNNAGSPLGSHPCGTKRGVIIPTRPNLIFVLTAGKDLHPAEPYSASTSSCFQKGQPFQSVIVSVYLFR